ncbi:response regulator [Uliginosibacterium sp. H3]|uniref:Response regulator n=1 Tax=Uliginosibacterium silvisoli TaxID=3114758 RepID=A0ABU6K721_9RHOO|nr:response regulator [Uliginosibacterium sp. H3]
MTASLLVVDDEPINLEIISEFLEDEPFSLSLADSGEAAWRLLDERPSAYNAVILDRMMPGMSGIDLLRRIKADPRMEHLPVIMQTAAAASEQVAEGLAAGAYYYLIKPYERTTLLSIINAALEDLTRWDDLTQRMSHNVLALSLASEAQFMVRTLEEAQAVAGLVAQVAAEPETAVVGLAELLVNGVEHGNLGIDFAGKSRLKYEESWAEEVERRLALPENQHKRVRLHLQACVEGWKVTISDDGEGFDWQSFLEVAPERAFAPNGRGIVLARKLAFTRVTYLGKGNHVEVLMPAARRN